MGELQQHGKNRFFSFKSPNGPNVGKQKTPCYIFRKKEEEKCTFLLFPLSLKEVLEGINMKKERKVKKDTLL